MEIVPEPLSVGTPFTAGSSIAVMVPVMAPSMSTPSIVPWPCVVNAPAMSAVTVMSLNAPALTVPVLPTLPIVELEIIPEPLSAGTPFTAGSSIAVMVPVMAPSMSTPSIVPWPCVVNAPAMSAVTVMSLKAPALTVPVLPTLPIVEFEIVPEPLSAGTPFTAGSSIAVMVPVMAPSMSTPSIVPWPCVVNAPAMSAVTVMSLNAPALTVPVLPTLPFARTFVVAQNSGQQPRDRVNHHHRRQRAVRQHIIADGQFVVGQRLAHAFVKTFVTAADQQQIFFLRKFARNFLRKFSSARRKQNHFRFFALQTFNRFKERFDFQQHSRSAAERFVVHRFVPVVRPVAQVVDFQIQQLASRARLTMLSSSGPANIAGNKVSTSIFIRA